MGLKDDLVANISNAVKAIQVIQVSSREESVVFRNSHWQCHELLKHLDRAFLHRRRHVRNGYWKIVAEFTPKVDVLEIRRLRNVTTDLGRGRAWLFMALNDSLLESYICCFQQNQKLLSKYYVRDALVRDQERLNILVTLAAGLENAVFQLEMDMPYLDLCACQPKRYTLTESSDKEKIILCSSDIVVYTRHSLPPVSQSVNNIFTVSTDSGSAAYKDTCLLRPQRKQHSQSLNLGFNIDANVRHHKEYKGDYEQEARFRRIEALMNSDNDMTDGSSKFVVTFSKYQTKDKSKACNKIKIHDVSKESLLSHSHTKSEENSYIQLTSYTTRPTRKRKVYLDNATDSHKAGCSVMSIKSCSDLCGSTIDGLNIQENSVDTLKSRMRSINHYELSLETSKKGDNKIFTEQLNFDQESMRMNVVSEHPREKYSNHKCCNDNDVSEVKTGDKSMHKPKSSDCDNNTVQCFTKTLQVSDVQYNGDFSQCHQNTEQPKVNPVCFSVCCGTNDIYTKCADHEEELSISTVQTSMATILNISQTLKEEKKSNQLNEARNSAVEPFDDRSASNKLDIKEPTELHSLYASLKISCDQTKWKKSFQLDNAYSDEVQLSSISANENACEKLIAQSNVINSNSGIFTNKAATERKSPHPSKLMNSCKLVDIWSSQNEHNEDINVDKLANENLATEISSLHIQNRDNDSINKPIASHYFCSVMEADSSVIDLKDPVVENEDRKLCPGEVSLDIHSMLFLMLDVMDTDEKFTKMFSCLLGYTEGETRIIFLLISSRSLYLLTQERKDGKFTKVAVIWFPEIDFVSLGWNYQFIQITCKKRNEQYCLSTGDEMSTRAIVHCLVSAMENDYHPIKLTVDTEATTQRETFKKFIANESKCDSTDVKLQYYALVHWEDPQTWRGRAGLSEREGYLLYKPKTSYGLVQSNTWNRAYAVLRDCMLCIYNDKNDLTPHILVNLGKEECVGCKLDLNSERPHSIKIILASGDDFWLSLSMEMEVIVWLQSLCQALSEGLQKHPAHTSCLPFCLILTSQKLLMCHENLQTRSIRTMGNANLVDIKAVRTDSTLKTFCVMEFGSPEAKVSSDKWVFYFSSENESNKFLHALSACMSDHFQTEILQLPMEDVILQRKCREMAIFLENELKPKPVQ
ncbi:hypothetical protein CHS0354_011893 [Potamilus streckersoni]|uniref:Pleckstrin homology domain-containing family M member 2 n=1 Tax=Potamilus streckersoni TaxID=2493646 RepID=A0AAE0T010_9BIVA|nr:hypothetical protein CHS0354_011893 [Potamilus streckersoni]